MEVQSRIMSGLLGDSYTCKYEDAEFGWIWVFTGVESLLNKNKVGCLANGNSRIFSRHLATLDHKLNIKKGIPRKHDGLSVSFILKSLYGVV